jgi:NAD(P)-dependent dehydrogenase (short-subunit alcohol dehydrogenase family)
MNTLPFPYDFTGQVAVVTGGARGFGFEFAKALAERGATAILADLNADAGERAAAAIRAEGNRAAFVPLDVRDPGQAADAAAFAESTGGRLDLWINNAGLARHGASETLSKADWSDPVDIMLSGTFHGAQAAARAMLPSGGGTIVNIASVNGLLGQSGRAAYASAKAGVVRLTAVLGAEWAARGVRVNAIAPAVFLTDLVKSSLADGSASLDVYIRRSPTGRLGEVPELVSTLLFLASPYSSYIVGQTLKVDGGWTADHYV